MPSGLPVSRLNLKVGASIILLQNLYPASRECNGTKMIIIQLGQRYIEVRIFGGEFHDQLYIIPRIKLTTTKVICLIFSVDNSISSVYIL